eukprot:14222722-Ditylum_brightwellii.AAC.1
MPVILGDLFRSDIANADSQGCMGGLGHLLHNLDGDIVLGEDCPIPLGGLNLFGRLCLSEMLSILLWNF